MCTTYHIILLLLDQIQGRIYRESNLGNIASQPANHSEFATRADVTGTVGGANDNLNFENDIKVG